MFKIGTVIGICCFVGLDETELLIQLDIEVNASELGNVV